MIFRIIIEIFLSIFLQMRIFKNQIKKSRRRNQRFCAKIRQNWTFTFSDIRAIMKQKQIGRFPADLLKIPLRKDLEYAENQTRFIHGKMLP